MAETLAELAKRQTVHPPSVPCLGGMVSEILSGMTVATSKSSAPANLSLLQRAMESPLFKRSNLPGRALEAIGRGNQSQLWGQAKSHAERICQVGGMVLLCGQRWTGKTVMAAAIALGFLDRRQGAVYTRGIGLLKDLRMDFNQNSTESREVVRPYQKWHLLIVDEVGLRVKGEAGYSDSDAALFTDLIDQRYSNRLATLFISNESQSQTFEKLGPSITRRIEETGQVIEATWPSFGDAA